MRHLEDSCHCGSAVVVEWWLLWCGWQGAAGDCCSPSYGVGGSVAEVVRLHLVIVCPLICSPLLSVFCQRPPAMLHHQVGCSVIRAVVPAVGCVVVLSCCWLGW